MPWGFLVRGIKLVAWHAMFDLQAPFQPCGDQPVAIAQLVKGLEAGKKGQVLLGVTGSGKTFTMAHVIQKIQRPTLVIAHNKTLAAQLYQEFRAFFPHNAVEYFVSYYDYYQPEAYIPRTDTYIEKDMAINDKIDKMRLAATRALLERPDVLIVASVSCIYGLGTPEYYRSMQLGVEAGQTQRREDLLLHLVEMQYRRSDMDLMRSTFRVRGDNIEIFPAYEEDIAYRLQFFGDVLEQIWIIDPLTGKRKDSCPKMVLYPSSHHVTPQEVRLRAIESIRQELAERLEVFEQGNQLVERQRLEQRTRYDMEMLKETGFCKGIENYSRHFSQRSPGEPPPCLLDYFPRPFLTIIDESHQTIPQLRAMCAGDRARKETLVEYGFRLPSAFDNRPLRFEETYQRLDQLLYVSATPAKWEIEEAQGEIVEQILRPTGLLDPPIEVRPAVNQVDDCLEQIHQEVNKKGRVLVTTLTKRLSEELTRYLTDLGLKAKYLHSDIDTLERMEIIQGLRQGLFDVLVGINLLREGLDIPEVTLIAILDADKEGFLRSETALIQTCGRAARNSAGRVLMYADKRTAAIEATIQITRQRRQVQQAYNRAHGIEPKTVVRERRSLVPEEVEQKVVEAKLSAKEVEANIRLYEEKMRKAAHEHRFEEAARYRDLMRAYQQLEIEI